MDIYFSRISQFHFMSPLPLSNLILYFTEICLPQTIAKLSFAVIKSNYDIYYLQIFHWPAFNLLHSVLGNPKCYCVPQLSVPKVVIVSLRTSGMAENGTVGQGGAAARWNFEKFIKLFVLVQIWTWKLQGNQIIVFSWLEIAFSI